MENNNNNNNFSVLRHDSSLAAELEAIGAVELDHEILDTEIFGGKPGQCSSSSYTIFCHPACCAVQGC